MRSTLSLSPVTWTPDVSASQEISCGCVAQVSSGETLDSLLDQSEERSKQSAYRQICASD